MEIGLNEPPIPLVLHLVRRYFYVFEPPRPLDAIDADLARVTNRIKARIEELSA